MRWLRGLLTWQVAAPIIAYLLSILLVVSVVEAFIARQEATDARNRTAAAASRRIDLLNAEITRLQNRLAQDARERGRLEETIRVLVEQVRRIGGTPIETAPSRGGASPASNPTPRPSPTHTPSSRPTPHPSPSPTPRPTPSPSPTRCPLLQHPLHCL